MALAKKDIRHLEWIYDRMKSVHNENVNFDYMITFLKIIGKLHEEYVQEHQIKPAEQPDLPAPNTVMWWLCRIADPEIRRKAVRKCSRNEEHEKTTSVNEALAQAFVWEYKGMWHKLYGEEIPLLSEPDFTEYLELRK